MARWHSCNILKTGDPRQVWHFDAHGGEFKLDREQTMRDGELLPLNLVGKSWATLFQPKLNVAWLPPENVFLRVAQFPVASPEETRTMVELQIEKLSPIPITQAVWTMHVFPRAAGPAGRSEVVLGNMQTIVVTIVARAVVEELLGKLEGAGFMADRLEVPMLDQLQAVPVNEDGAWIYPEAQGGNCTVLVAWWYDGLLKNVDYITLTAGQDRAASLKDQLVQMAWAGELEGWLTSSPRWHLVAATAVAAEWEGPLRQGLDQPVEIIAPLPGTELAAHTARRAAQSDPLNTLLPAEFAGRYRQQFQDRLWMRGLGAVLALYVVGVIIYFIAVGFLSYQTGKVEDKVAADGPGYTNALATIARYGVLKDREELKYAALDCWQSLAELLPSGVVLESLTFNDGKKMTISGTAPAQQVNDIIDFCDKLRKRVVRGQPLFKSGGGEVPSMQTNPGGVRWSFGLELKRVEVQ